MFTVRGYISNETTEAHVGHAKLFHIDPSKVISIAREQDSLGVLFMEENIRIKTDETDEVLVKKYRKARRSLPKWIAITCTILVGIYLFIALIAFFWAIVGN